MLLNNMKKTINLNDNTHGKNNYFWSDKTNNKYIKLSLIEKHYILNETNEWINKYYFEHYEEINKHSSNKHENWRMKVYTLKTRKWKKVYETDNKQAHMKSYDLIQIMTSDKITCSFDEICYIKNNLYEFSNK